MREKDLRAGDFDIRVLNYEMAQADSIGVSFEAKLATLTFELVIEEDGSRVQWIDYLLTCRPKCLLLHVIQLSLEGERSDLKAFLEEVVQDHIQVIQL